MKPNQYGIQFKIAGKPYDNHPLDATLDALESLGRKAFRNPECQSVVIYDAKGRARRYFKRTEKGIYIEKLMPNSPLTRQ
jgi:hypothetical protein